MLTAVKNQIKVSYLSTKYALMREMINKTTFLMNVIFMILNNSTFLIQWLLLYSLKDNIGGYTFKQIILLWGIAAATYGVSHFFFENAQNLSEIITNGKLDSFLVQPKNVLLTTITSNVTTSALGDYIFGIVAMIISGFTIPKFILFIIISFTGGIVITDFSVILGSLSFWFGRADMIADTNGFVKTILLISCFAKESSRKMKAAPHLPRSLLYRMQSALLCPAWCQSLWNRSRV